MAKVNQRSKRSRGVILSPEGFKRLQKAQADAELTANHGNPYNLEDLSALTGLSAHTLIKVRRRQSPVDRNTLEDYFKAFHLTLLAQDYIKPDTAISKDLNHSTEGQLNPPTVDRDVGLSPPEPSSSANHPSAFRPEGQVPLDSMFYIDRPPTEIDCYQAIVQSGALIRVKAPRRTGKTSLIARILKYASQNQCKTVFLSFQLADKDIFQDLSKFLQWFSANVGRGLDLPNQLADYWDEMFGSKMSCKIYFEQYLLPQTSQPIVLALDDVDRLFHYPDLADEFFGLLRTWHEEAKNRDIWKQLRLVVGHSTEVYIPLNVNKSPFNVGLPIELGAFTIEQVEDLVTRYDLRWSRTQTEQLMDKTNGHPYLVQLALHSLQDKNIALDELLLTSSTTTGIYSDHLQRQWWVLEQDPELVSAYSQVLNASTPTPLELPQAFKLESMGLVQLQGNQAIPHCSLYNQYFRDRLAISKS